MKRVVLVGGVVFFLVLILGGIAGAQVCVQPPGGLVSWWPGDGNADDIVDGNHGTLQNGATFAAGQDGQAFDLDGDDDFVRVEDSAEFAFGTGELTIDAWIKAPSDTTFRIIVVKASASFPFHGAGLRIANDNRVEFLVTDCGTGACGFSLPGGGGSRQPVRSSSIVADDAFHHVAGVRRADGTLEIHVDGVLENTRVEAPRNPDSTEPLVIGALFFQGAPSDYFRGLVDEVQIYNRALTAEEIAAIFNAGSAGQCKASGQCALQLTQCQADLAAADQELQNSQSQLDELTTALTNGLISLTNDFRSVFNDPTFVISGATPLEQYQNLINAILNLNKGRKEGLYVNLGGK